MEYHKVQYKRGGGKISTIEGRCSSVLVLSFTCHWTTLLEMTKNKEKGEKEPSVRNCTCKVRGNNLNFASYSHSRTGEHIHTHTHATHDKQRRVNCIRGKQKVVRGTEESGTFFLVKVKGREAKGCCCFLPLIGSVWGKQGGE